MTEEDRAAVSDLMSAFGYTALTDREAVAIAAMTGTADRLAELTREELAAFGDADARLSFAVGAARGVTAGSAMRAAGRRRRRPPWMARRKRRTAPGDAGECDRPAYPEGVPMTATDAARDLAAKVAPAIIYPAENILPVELLVRIEALRLATPTYGMPAPLFFDGEDDEALQSSYSHQNAARTAADAARLTRRSAELEAAVIARSLRAAARYADYLMTGELLSDGEMAVWAHSLGEAQQEPSDAAASEQDGTEPGADD